MRASFLIIATAVLLGGCASSVTKDIRVDTDVDPKVNFGGYSTYAWLGSAALVHDPDGQWEPPDYDSDAEIRFLIDREMHARGLVIDNKSPDVLVFYGAGINMNKTEVRIDPDSELETLSNLPKGALKVILIDAGSRKPVWGGFAIGDVQEKIDRKTSKRRLDYAVESMFKKFPN